MKFVILSNATIPGYGGIKGPILTPQEIPLKKVLDMVSLGFEIFEVMEDGSRRKVQFSDERIVAELLKQKHENQTIKAINDDVKSESKSDQSVKDSNLFKDCRLLTGEEIEEIFTNNDTSNKYEDKEIKKDRKNNNNKSDKKTELPKIDKVEKISDDK